MRKARAIFQNIYSSEETTEEKENAIRKVIGMETHNSFTKQEFINALDWLLNEHSWIPCSERLPEVNVPVLTCDKSGWISVHINMPYIGNVKNDFECGYYVAWQPLPAPYKGVQS